jgi:hypothetical protein
MALLVGRPAKLYFLDMDTGSDLTWLQCDAPCRSCAPVSFLILGGRLRIHILWFLGRCRCFVVFVILE